MTILVTGGAGFIGSNFILDWVAGSDEEIVNIDNLKYEENRRNHNFLPREANYTFVEGDIADVASVTEVFKRHMPRAVINFAADSHVDKSIERPLMFVETNVAGAVRLLDVSCLYWQSLPKKDKKRFRFIQISTDEVFGSLKEKDEGFSEITAYAPNSPYSASKASADHFVRAYHHTYGLPAIVTNCTNNYGPRQFPDKLIPLVIKNSLDGDALPIYGDGKHSRDWLFVADHCRAIRRVLEGGTPGAVYNIGGDNEWENIKLVTKICSLLDATVPRPDNKTYLDLIEFVKDRPGHDRRYAVDNSKIKRELDWIPLEDFDTGLKKTISWYLANREWLESFTSRQKRVFNRNT